MKAICISPVELYDAELTGIYMPGDVVEGDKATVVLNRYPQYFSPLKAAKEKEKNA